MRLLELDRSGGILAQAFRDLRTHEQPRTGLHVSTIVDRMVRYVDPKAYASEFSDTQIHGYQEFGNIVEDVCAHRLRRRVAGWRKPLPRVHRGITGSPDGWSPGSRAIHEIKACWKSEAKFFADTLTRRSITPLDLVACGSLKLYAYVLQIVMYAEMWDADRAYLHVLFVNGSYRPPAPSPRTITIVFTVRERRRMFNDLRQFAKDIELL